MSSGKKYEFGLGMEGGTRRPRPGIVQTSSGEMITPRKTALTHEQDRGAVLSLTGDVSYLQAIAV